MRQILVDYARERKRAKRGGGCQVLALDEALLFAPSRPDELVALDDALQALARLDPRKVEIVELRYFGGLSVVETAAALGVHPNTVIRDWKLARAWLKRELSSEDHHAG
jgi:RNA polymerase sigma-70 factor, ECF subfamily